MGQREITDDLETVRKATDELFGGLEDLSDITQELLDEMRTDAIEIDDSFINAEVECNTLTAADGGVYWRPRCNARPWHYRRGSVYYKRIPNCTNGFRHYRIRF